MMDELRESCDVLRSITHAQAEGKPKHPAGEGTARHTFAARTSARTLWLKPRSVVWSFEEQLSSGLICPAVTSPQLGTQNSGTRLLFMTMSVQMSAAGVSTFEQRELSQRP